MPRETAPAKPETPMALRILDDLLEGHLLIYPAKLHARHGGKREAWYKCCAMMARAGWLADTAAGGDKAYRAGPKCWAIGDATLNGLEREHDLIVDAIHEVGQSLRAMRRARAEALRKREAATQPELPIDRKCVSADAFDPDKSQTEPQTQGVAL
ncbi:MAG: hypothetical protein KF684_04190 [Phycisphaeraceae bacterium]|nr:hypothetical protein [Phycisphaeraceae bacterium]